MILTLKLKSNSKEFLSLLSDSPKQIDELSSSLHMNSSTILAYLLSLEFNGYIKQLPGKFFMKL